MALKPIYIISNAQVITLLLNKQVKSIDPTHANYSRIKSKLLANDFDGLESLLDTAKAIVKQTAKASKGNIKVANGVVTYKGKPVSNAVTNKIIEFVNKGLDFNPFVKFLERLMVNASEHSRENLYRFCEKWGIIIGVDGHLLVYKRVDNNYKDFHTRTFDNSVGAVVEMPREQVVDDPSQGCSRGLHVANYQYAKNFYSGGAGRLIVCKVDPADVCSVPFECEEQKIRVCKYEVLEDYSETLEQERYVPAAPVEDRADTEEDDYEDEDCPDCGEAIDDCTCDETDEEEAEEYCDCCGNLLDECDCDDDCK